MIPIGAIPGIAGGVLRNLETITDLETLKGIDPVKVVRTIVLSSFGGWYVATTGVTNMPILVMAGYFGDLILLNLGQAARRILKI